MSCIIYSLKPLIIYLAAKPARLTRGDLARRVNADYYGYRDEDDGVIIALEEEEEKKGENNACYMYK